MAKVVTDTLGEGLREMALRLGDSLGERFVQQAKDHASRRTGAMADSVVAEAATMSGDTVTVHVEVGAEHGIYQDEGTGIFGPEGRPITPVRARVLRFDWPAAGGIVFAHSVQGSEPTRWWTKTVAMWDQIVRRASVGG